MNAVASRNVKFISHSDQGGRGDGVQIMVHRGYAYIGHGYSNGISIILAADVRANSTSFMPRLLPGHGHSTRNYRLRNGWISRRRIGLPFNRPRPARHIAIVFGRTSTGICE